MKKKWFYYPGFLSKQGYLFKAAKTKRAFVKVNLFKQNNFIKIPKSMGGGTKVHGSRFGTWGNVNHLIEEDNPGIYVYFRSTANELFYKKNKFKNLRLI